MERAHKYRITDIETVWRIATLSVSAGTDLLPAVVIDEGFLERESYLAGAVTELPDLSIYEHTEEKLPEDYDE